MKAMLFAAGLGSRLKPYTENMPKALVPIKGKPLLGYALNKLKLYGFDEVIVNVHHFADMIYDYLSEHEFGLYINVSDEQDVLLETGGGILHAESLLKGNSSFLVHNVDILSNVDLKAFFEHHHKEHLATLLVSERKTDRYLLFDSSMQLVGWTNEKSGEVRTPYDDIDVDKCHKLAFAGIHVLSDYIFDCMDGWSGKFSIIDFYLAMCKDHIIQGVMVEGMEMLDVGKPDSLIKAKDFIEKYYKS